MAACLAAHHSADNRGVVGYVSLMPVLDEEAAKKKLAHEIGEDLSKLSLDELATRTHLLKAEIARLEAAAEAKKASARVAASFFKT